MSRNLVKFAVMAALAAGGLSTTAEAASKVIKVGINVTEQHYEYKAMEAFKAYVEDKTDGAIEVQLYSNSLGNDLEILDAIKLGTVQMNLPTPSVLGNIVKDFRLPDLPFIFPNLKVAHRVADSAWAQALLDELEPVGYVGLAIGDFGFRHISNSARPITSLEDLKGLKIRVMQNKATLDIFRQIGVNPTPMAFAEVFSALQLGTVDGQENPYANTYQQRFYEVQKYLSNSGHAYSWVILVIGKTFFDSLDDQEQAVVREAADVWRTQMREASRRADTEALAKMIAAGSIYTEMTPEARDAILQAAWPAVERQGNAVSEEMFEGLMAAIDAAGE